MPSTDVPGFDEEASGAPMTSSSLCSMSGKVPFLARLKATPNRYLRNENRWRLLKMSFQVSLYEIVSYRSRVYKSYT